MALRPWRSAVQLEGAQCPPPDELGNYSSDVLLTAHRTERKYP